MVSLPKVRPCDPRSQLALAFTSSGASFTSTSTPSRQPHVSTTQVGTHSARSSPAHTRSASTALTGTHSAIGADSRAGRGPFPKPRPVVLPMVSFGQTKPAGLGHSHNADSEPMHHPSRLFILQWNPGPARRNPTQIIAAACGRFQAVILQEASDHVPTSPTSSLRTLATRTSPSCSTRTPLSPILRFSPVMKPRPAKIHGAWCYSPFEAFCVALLSQAPLRSRFALHTSTMSWPRNVMRPLIYHDAHTCTCTSTTATLLAVTST